MKRILLVLGLLQVLIAQSQLININPNKSAEPWLVGSVRSLSDSEIARIPELTMPVGYRSTEELPSFLDNSESIHFRPVFNQSHGSCAQSSGVAYTFTYEMNRIRGSVAASDENLYPSHFTYNFLNNGSGENGSIYTDGWGIIKANGCPSIATYGGLDATETHWMSGYAKYQSAMQNRIKDFFYINAGTPEGLETLKHWLNDHLEDAETGGVLNFSAGVTDEFNMQYASGHSSVIVEWGHAVNHAMTIVGWDDSISYDYNSDGQYTNDIDINYDGVVDMKDWEVGALIMVNSWGTYWGEEGKAYIMYKTLAEPVENGGIRSHRVFGIHVKEALEPQLTMEVKMTHSSRNKISIKAGVATSLTATEPEFEMSFPLFNKQGGNNQMKGDGISTPLDLSLDITSLLNYINSGETSQFFLMIEEDDPYNEASGMLYDFAITLPDGTTLTCSDHNVSVLNNTTTYLSITSEVVFEAPEIMTETLPVVVVEVPYSQELTAEGGQAPYNWCLLQDYIETSGSGAFPSITSGVLTPTNNDDGYATQILDFDFPFYGKTYNELYISTDGSLLFEPGFDYLRTEEAIKSKKMIGVFAYDLLYESGNALYYEGDDTSATFRWKATTWTDDSAEVDVAVKLFPSGEIEFYYGNSITSGLDWVSGVSDGKGNYKIASISGLENPTNMSYNMISEPFPNGMQMSEDGVFYGTAPAEVMTWNLKFKVTDNNNVSSTKVIPFETQTIGCSEIVDNSISVFPNPAQSFAKIETDAKIEQIQVLGLNSEILQSQIDSNLIKLTNLNSGVYLLKIYTSKGVFIEKLIVNH